MIKMKVEKRGRANPHPTKILHQNVSLESISHFFRGKKSKQNPKKVDPEFCRTKRFYSARSGITISNALTLHSISLPTF